MGTDIFYANFAQSKNQEFFINRYIPQLGFSSKIFDLNLVKIKLWDIEKKKFTPGHNWNVFEF